jgi:hypothetical protein
MSGGSVFKQSNDTRTLGRSNDNNQMKQKLLMLMFQANNFEI